MQTASDATKAPTRRCWSHARVGCGSSSFVAPQLVSACRPTPIPVDSAHKKTIATRGAMVLAVPPTFRQRGPGELRRRLFEARPPRPLDGNPSRSEAMPWAWITAPTPSSPTCALGRTSSGRDSRVHSVAAGGYRFSACPVLCNPAGRRTTPDQRRYSFRTWDRE